MASTSSEPSHPVLFTTETPYPLPSQKFMIPASWKRYQLSQLVNKALSLSKPIPFDFLVRGEILRGSLGEWCAEKGIGEEETLEIEYFESVMPPQKTSSLPHEDWVSAVSCQLPGHFLTASYDGFLRVFDYSQKLLHASAAHQAPITSLCVVPAPSSSPSASTQLLITGSHDLTAHLTQLSIPDSGPDEEVHTRTLASLHLHTAAVSSVSSSASGSHVLTSSWDTLIGVWDTSIPTIDEVPLDESDRKKRRKVDDDAQRPRRKAPLTVLKSHTARVSKAVFDHGAGEKAYSCGFDSTVRTWDVENGVCAHTITASSKPFLDLALTQSGNSALAASTDRTVCQYDLRASTTSAITPSTATLAHPATPSCIVVPPPSSDSGPGAEHQLLTGAYDGVVRLWDLRSVKSAVTSFKAWEQAKAGRKVLSVDWARGIVGVGGEGGVEVWRVGHGERALPS
ncbi:WD40 repeat-like protein [Laetiporus sulphureus 93-53]|uniref:Ribosome biogenesis protein YTM1 n=1 Tax=Laetiporus sulphureus 93-53 TaxID=1314785 RepID=A0A165F286_9APHY|nr:WD40 repeat-like protein [Laetiporus sulphureus 93-53]KZT08219.1 WD40 repeat-like protein [Laetiporus sulphureus 93-53]